jgi:RNA polymerase sigma factor (sigma-70 family)
MAAKRTSGDDSVAAEASQLVFILLAQKAKSLASRHSLAGWLHLSAVMQAKNLVRKNRRESHKRQRLQAAMEPATASHSGELWNRMQPVLDELLTTLSDKEREAILLRFYRSLSVREVAETLGITVHASQKRIDRAVEKLREKFTRRGIQLGTSLSGVMLAGFAGDAQAASFPISSIAAKAIAASSSSASLATNLSTLKASTYIPPILAIVVIAAWVGSQRASISKIEEDTVAVQKQIDAADSKLMLAASQTPKPTTANPSGGGGSSIEWNEFVENFAKMRASRDRGPYDTIERTLQSMTEEELVAELEVVRALDVPPMYHGMLEGMVMTPLIQKAPHLALNRFMDHPSMDSDNWHGPNDVLKKWVMSEPEEASAWLDAHIADGKFDSKSLDGKNQLRILFERTVTGVLLESDPEAAVHRVAALPENQRGDVLLSLDPKSESQVAFANLVRQYVPEPEQARILSDAASRAVMGDGYEAATTYFNRIEATPAERKLGIESVAISQFQHLARTSGITAKDVDALREWTDSISPESTDLLTGKALGQATAGGGRNPSLPDLAELAIQYHQTSGNDDVLVGFLNNPMIYLMSRGQISREQFIEITQKVSDVTQRGEILELLDDYFPNP